MMDANELHSTASPRCHCQKEAKIEGKIVVTNLFVVYVSTQNQSTGVRALLKGGLKAVRRPSY